jgi:hypothetical protein
MKIIKLQASNIKRLVAVEITPTGNIVTLSGENGAGKSSVLDAIWFTLGGKDAICEVPIRRGASEAESVLTLGANGVPELVVTRRITAASTTLTVKNADGVSQKSPQGILDALTGMLAFDPLAFARMEPAKALATLQKLVGLDLSKQNAEIERLYGQRTLVNRDVDSAKNRLAATSFDATAPATEVDVADLMRHLASVNADNKANQQKRNAVDWLYDTVQTLASGLAVAKDELEKAQVKVERITKEHAAAVLKAEDEHESLGLFPDADTSELEAQIANAGNINRKVSANAEHAKIKQELASAQQKSKAFTAQLEAVEQSKNDALSKCKFPLPGLSFNATTILLNDIPFAQASDGEKLRASVAMGMAMNPKLRVIFVRDASLLDQKSLAIISDLAKANDYQVWEEDSRSTEPTAILIEDGHIAKLP